MADPFYFQSGVEQQPTEFSSTPTYAPVAPPPPAPVGRTEVRGSELSDIPGNIGLDVVDLAKGLYEMASLPVARIYEATPWAGSQPLLRASDVDDVKNMAMGIFDQYKTNYWDPIAEGRPLDVLKYGAQYPVMFLGDAIPVLNAMKVPKFAGLAAKTAAQTAVGQRALGQAGNLAKKLYADVSTIAPPVADAVDMLKAEQNFVDPIRREAHKAIAEVDRGLAWYDQAPAAERKILKQVLEGLMPPPPTLSEAGQKFIDAVRKQNELTAGWLQKDGLATAADIELTRYIPAVLKRFGGEVKDYPPDTLRSMAAQIKKELDAKGIDPTYVPWMQSRSVQKELSTPWWKIPDKYARTAMAKVADPNAEAKLGFNQARKGAMKDEYHQNPKELLQARFRQVAKYHLYFEKLLDQAMKAGTSAEDFVKLPAEEMAKLAPFNPRQFFKDATRHLSQLAGSKEFLADVATAGAEIPEQIFLPKGLAKVLNGATSQASVMERAFGFAAGFARRYMLGTNLAWPEKQLIQNESMIWLSQFKGPQDLVKTISAAILAQDKNVVRSIPAHLLGDVSAKPPGLLPTPVGAAIDKFADWNFGRAAKYDEFFRSRVIIYYALEMSEKLGFKPILFNMIDTAEAINRISGVATDSALAVELAKKVNSVAGDYSMLTMNTGLRAHLRNLFMWYSWYEHIVRFGAQLPASNPFKTSIVNHMAQVTPLLYEDKNAPEYLREAGAIKIQGKYNPQGLPEYAMASSMSPLGTLPELYTMATAPFNDKAGDGAGAFSTINPLFSIAIAAIGKKNPSTLRDFNNPNLVHSGGKQYDPDDVKKGKLEEIHPVPNLAELLLRNTFATPTRATERIYAKLTEDAEPSQFTTPWLGEAAPKKVASKGYQQMAADELPDIGLQLLLGFRALPIDEQAAKMQEFYEPQRWAQAMKAKARQMGNR